jgi:hypothetical protein
MGDTTRKVMGTDLSAVEFGGDMNSASFGQLCEVLSGRRAKAGGSAEGEQVNVSATEDETLVLSDKLAPTKCNESTQILYIFALLQFFTASLLYERGITEIKGTLREARRTAKDIFSQHSKYLNFGVLIAIVLTTKNIRRDRLAVNGLDSFGVDVRGKVVAELLTKAIEQDKSPKDISTDVIDELKQTKAKVGPWIGKYAERVWKHVPPCIYRFKQIDNWFKQI